MARYLALLSAAAVALAAPPAASAALRWSGPIPLDHSGATALTAISCPSTTRCVSVDAVGQVVVFNPTKVGAAVPMLVDPIGGFTAVSCPTTTQCTAVDRAGQQVTFDPGAPGGATPVNVSTGQALTALACPATHQCTAVGGVGQAYTFDPTLPSGTQTTTSIVSTAPTTVMTGIDCPSTIQCTAVDSAGDLITFNPLFPGTPHDFVPDAAQSPTGVSCPSATQCTAVTKSGFALTFSTSGPDGDTALQLETGSLTAVACRPTAQCVAVDNAGKMIDFTSNAASPPATIDGARALSAIACPSDTQCTAVDVTSFELTFAPADPASRTFAMLDRSNHLRSVACPLPTQCTAVGDLAHEVTFNPSAPQGAVPKGFIFGIPGPLISAACPIEALCFALFPSGSEQLQFIPTSPEFDGVTLLDSGSVVQAEACPATTQCTAIDNAGREVTFDPQNNVSQAPVPLSNAALVAVACRGTGQCTALDTGEGIVTFDPQFPNSNRESGSLGSGSAPTALACPAGGQCTAVDAGGDEVTFNPDVQPPNAAGRQIDPAGGLTAVDCPSTSQCVAVDKTGHVIEFDPNGAATVTTLAGAGLIESIACPSTLECVAVDALGDLFVGGITPPANVGAPTIAGSPVQGQTLTETQGIWTNSPTGFALQWQDCDSAGNRCVAIPGATAPTLTLTSADVNHTIRVTETASNAAGSGTPASSAATELVTAPAAPPTTTPPPPPPSSPSPPSIQISAAQIKAGLLAQISPHAARIATLLKRRGYTLTFTALTAGRLTINWTSVAPAGPARATPGKAGVLVAAGTGSFTKAGTLRLQIKLTAAGRRLLAAARRLRLSARGTFVPTGQSAIIALTRFTLAR